MGKVIAAEGAANATITLAEQGSIEGEIRAQVVVISGRLDGDVYASEKVELTPTARVAGNIHYQVVEMNAGAQLTGLPCLAVRCRRCVPRCRRGFHWRAGPMATAAVPIMAWCSLPMDMARTSKSMSPASTRLPLDDT